MRKIFFLIAVIFIQLVAVASLTGIDTVFRRETTPLSGGTICFAAEKDSTGLISPSTEKSTDVVPGSEKKEGKDKFTNDQMTEKKGKKEENEKREIEKFIASLIEQVATQHKYSGWLEIAIMILTATIGLTALFNTGSMIFVLFRIRSFRKELDEEIKAIDPRMEKYVGAFVFQNFSHKFEEISNWAEDKIDNFLEQDFLSRFEERYLALEYVHFRTWDKVSAAIRGATTETEKMRYWDLLFRVQMALRQLVSTSPGDVFTGLGTLRSIARMELIPPRALWALLCILKRQGRLNEKNLGLARNLGRDLGLTFRDCPQEGNPRPTP